MTATRRAPIRVAFCLDSMETGGTELNAVRTAEHFDPARVRVDFFALRMHGPLVQRVRDSGFSVEEIPVKGLISAKTLRLAASFARRLRRERYDVLHAHDVYTNSILVPWARLAGIPLVVASRRWWTETNHPLHTLTNRLSYRFAHAVLANSESVGRLVVQEGVPANKVVVIPNFVEDAAFVPPPREFLDGLNREWGIGEGDEVVGIVANLHSIKDHATLLRAAALLHPSHPRLKVVLVGDGSERERLEAQAHEAGLRDVVIFAGKRPHHPSPHWRFTLSVLSSRGEGFPNSIVEAMAAGRALVATAVGGVPDVVVDGETGILVPSGDAGRLAEAVSALLRDPARAASMGEAGARRARETFNANRVVRRLEEFYDLRLTRSS